MQRVLLIIISSFFFLPAICQNQVIVGDCTVTYAISGADASTNKNLQGASKTFYLKGKLSRVDLASSDFKQSIIYDAKLGSAVILKEVGSEKYKSVYTADQWKNENKRFDGSRVTATNEKKTILGYECKKLIVSMKDGNTYNMYCATAITPSVSENPYQFKDIAGFALEYEMSSGGNAKITYTAIMINFNPVPASKFEVPATGYRLLQ